MEKKLFVLDLDGTALINATTLHDKVIEGVAHVRSLGHEVIIATGRGYCSCIKFYNQLELDTPIVTLNGGRYLNPRNDNFKEKTYALENDRLDFIRSDEIFNKLIGCYYYEGSEMVLCMRDYSYWNKSTFDLLEDLGCTIVNRDIKTAKDVICLELVTKRGEAEYIKELIQAKFPDQRFNSWDGRSHESYLELCAQNADKWYAVKEVAAHLQVEEANIYTFGDANNDYLMIKNCQNGVAVGNANDNIKGVANIVLDKTNLEGCVGEFLLSF